MVVVRLIGVGLSAIRAATARVGGFPLLTVLVYVADEYPAVYAGAGALQASVVSFYGVVVILSDFLPCAWRCGAGRREKAKLGCV